MRMGERNKKQYYLKNRGKNGKTEGNKPAVFQYSESCFLEEEMDSLVAFQKAEWCMQHPEDTDCSSSLETF